MRDVAIAFFLCTGQPRQAVEEGAIVIINEIKVKLVFIPSGDIIEIGQATRIQFNHPIKRMAKIQFPTDVTYGVK